MAGRITITLKQIGPEHGNPCTYEGQGFLIDGGKIVEGGKFELPHEIAEEIWWRVVDAMRPGEQSNEEGEQQP